MKHQRPTQLLLMIFVIFMSSCSISIEKRLYRPGYHMEVKKPNKHSNHPNAQSNNPVKTNVNNLSTLNLSVDSGKTKDVLPAISTPSEISTNHQPKLNPIKSKNQNKWKDSCDVIVLATTGERIEAIVLEIKGGYVNYKKCDDLKGRVYTVKTRNVDNITLRNGEVYVPDDRIVVDKDKERKKSNTLFIMSIVALAIAGISFLLSFFIYPMSIISLSFSVIDLIFSFILLLLNMKPNKFTPSYRTKFTWIFCLIAFILLIAALVLVFV